MEIMAHWMEITSIMFMLNVPLIDGADKQTAQRAGGVVNAGWVYVLNFGCAPGTSVFIEHIFWGAHVDSTSTVMSFMEGDCTSGASNVTSQCIDQSTCTVRTTVPVSLECPRGWKGSNVTQYLQITYFCRVGNTDTTTQLNSHGTTVNQETSIKEQTGQRSTVTQTTTRGQFTTPTMMDVRTTSLQSPTVSQSTGSPSRSSLLSSTMTKTSSTNDMTTENANNTGQSQITLTTNIRTSLDVTTGYSTSNSLSSMSTANEVDTSALPQSTVKTDAPTDTTIGIQTTSDIELITTTMEPDTGKTTTKSLKTSKIASSMSTPSESDTPISSQPTVSTSDSGKTSTTVTGTVSGFTQSSSLPITYISTITEKSSSNNSTTENPNNTVNTKSSKTTNIGTDSNTRPDVTTEYSTTNSLSSKSPENEENTAASSQSTISTNGVTYTTVGIRTTPDSETMKTTVMASAADQTTKEKIDKSTARKATTNAFTPVHRSSSPPTTEGTLTTSINENTSKGPTDGTPTRKQATSTNNLPKTTLDETVTPLTTDKSVTDTSENPTKSFVTGESSSPDKGQLATSPSPGMEDATSKTIALNNVTEEMSLTTNKSTSTTGQDFTSSTSEAFEDINIGKARSREQNDALINTIVAVVVSLTSSAVIVIVLYMFCRRQKKRKDNERRGLPPKLSRNLKGIRDINRRMSSVGDDSDRTESSGENPARVFNRNSLYGEVTNECVTIHHVDDASESSTMVSSFAESYTKRNKNNHHEGSDMTPDLHFDTTESDDSTKAVYEPSDTASVKVLSGIPEIDLAEEMDSDFMHNDYNSSISGKVKFKNLSDSWQKRLAHSFSKL